MIPGDGALVHDQRLIVRRLDEAGGAEHHRCPEVTSVVLAAQDHHRLPAEERDRTTQNAVADDASVALAHRALGLPSRSNTWIGSRFQKKADSGEHGVTQQPKGVARRVGSGSTSHSTAVRYTPTNPGRGVFLGCSCNLPPCRCIYNSS